MQHGRVETVLYQDGVKTVGSIWVDNWNSKSSGTTDFTLWLETTGFNQLYEFDLDVTYVPMGNINMAQVHIHITASKGWKFK